MAVSEKAFQFLFKKFVVVVAMRDRDHASIVAARLQDIPLFKVISCTSSRKAESAIESCDHVHCCVCGSGMADLHNEELYLLKRFGDHIPFIMHVSDRNIALAAECMRFDAAAVMNSENMQNNLHALMIAVCNQSVKGVLFPFRSLRTHQSLHKSRTILFKTHPQDVTEWAIQCDMSRQHLHELWTNYCGATANLSLICFHLLCTAFTWYLNDALDRETRNWSFSSLRTMKQCTRKYENHQIQLNHLMFRKRGYHTLPVREYEHTGFYEAIIEKDRCGPWHTGNKKRKTA
ncbi:MAG: hypothetical protein JW768_01005 [Chitinispirillaceae bacterium]|nr:hypothetical protein [Chitinispirillaceae bacterium]